MRYERESIFYDKKLGNFVLADTVIEFMIKIFNERYEYLGEI